MKTFNVWYNAAAGHAQISAKRPDHHYDFCGEFKTRVEADAKLADIAGPWVWAVFATA